MKFINGNALFVWCVGVGIFLPVFFQLSGGLYVDLKVLADSNGILQKLPLPVSTITCAIGFICLIGRVPNAKPALYLIVGTLVLGLVSVLIGGDGVTSPQRKLMMLVQVILPMAGLILGQLLDDQDKTIAKAFLVVLFFVVPLQLFATKMQELDILAHHLYLFSIYSHRQFVTLIFVCAFAYSLTSLWNEYKFWLSILVVLMFFYVARSFSFLTILGYGFLVIAFAINRLLASRLNAKLVLSVSAVIVFAALMAGSYLGKIDGYRVSDLFLGKFSSVLKGNIPANVQERFDDWKRFGGGIFDSERTVISGHPEPMPREIRSSPHNWYVEQAYTFGFILLLPIVTLIGYTIYLSWIQRRDILPQTWWLIAIVFYLVLIDSNFKVTLRQPYPGIFAYFLWGLLLSQLKVRSANNLTAV